MANNSTPEELLMRMLRVADMTAKSTRHIGNIIKVGIGG